MTRTATVIGIGIGLGVSILAANPPVGVVTGIASAYAYDEARKKKAAR